MDYVGFEPTTSATAGSSYGRQLWREIGIQILHAPSFFLLHANDLTIKLSMDRTIK